MFKIKDVTLGFAPYGASQGSKSFSIYCESVEVPEGTEIDIKEKAADIVAEIDKIIEKKNIAPQWAAALLSKTQIQFYGDCLSEEDNLELATSFFEVLHKISLEMQKSVSLKNLRPPFMIFNCTPKNYSGRAMFYENFNVIQCYLDISNKNLMNEISPLACVEVNNHNFSVYILKVKNFEDLEVWKEFDKNKLAEISKERIFIYDMTNDDRTREYSLEEGFRYFKVDESIENLANLV